MNIKKLTGSVQKFVKSKREIILVAILLLISGIAHGVNMFNYPYYENDEGTYMSQAWSLLTSGKLAPYTYWYDHAPLGWFLIALWVKLTGGIFQFGMSVNSGRVLMMVLHIASTYFVYYIAKRLTGRNETGVVAGLVFSLSHLGIYYQRRVLLDNIMTFWIFAAWALLMTRKIKLSKVILSSLIFGVAVLTKENAIFFLPGFLYLLWIRAHREIRLMAEGLFLVISGSLISTYFLYAQLKKELFPTGFLGDTSEHVSLFGTLAQQFSRGNKLAFYVPGSDFYINYNFWLTKDPDIIIAGFASLLILTVISYWKKIYRIPALFTWLFVLFLIRGGLVINFYVVPLIPLFALALGVVFFEIAKAFTIRFRRLYYPVIIVLSLLLITKQIGLTPEHWIKNETKPQVEAVEWIKKNVAEDAYIIIDCYPYVDLHAARFEGDRVFPNADWFWKYNYDPEIQEKFGGSWQNVDYLLVTHEMVHQMDYEDWTNIDLRTAFKNAKKAAMFGPSRHTFVDLENYQSTNGDWAAVFARPSRENLALNSSWDFYKREYLINNEQVFDEAEARTTSEGQSYALLRAVWLNDKESFDRVWEWTRNNLQVRDDKLFSWYYTDGSVKDTGSASDADGDIALALVFAYKRWKEPSYLIDAIGILNDIWVKEVHDIDGRLILGFSADSARGDGIIINPSYLSPASYRIFSEVDTTHPWDKLAEDSYYWFDKIAASYNGVYLPPNFVYINSSGDISSAGEWFGEDSDIYGFDGFRTFFRVALDSYWFGTDASREYLKKAYPFFERKWKEDKNLFAGYTMTGKTSMNFSAISTLAGPLAIGSALREQEAQEWYKELVEKKYNIEEGYWGDRNNYYDQNWAWFATAMYSNNLPNLWNI